MVSDLSGETTKMTFFVTRVMIKKGQKSYFYFESEMSKKKNVTFVIFTYGP